MRLLRLSAEIFVVFAMTMPPEVDALCRPVNSTASSVTMKYADAFGCNWLQHILRYTLLYVNRNPSLSSLQSVLSRVSLTN